MPFRSKFNFPALRPSLERLWARRPAHLSGALPEGWRVVALPLGVAVGIHALWLLAASLGEGKRAEAPLLSSGDDTPELLRFSQRASQTAAAVKAPNLSMVPLPLDSTLPPPPPDLAFLAKGNPAPRGATSELRAPATGAASNPAAATARADLVPAERSSLEGLPSDPLIAYRLAVAIHDGKLPASTGSEGTGAAGEKGATADKGGAGAAAPGAPSPAVTAIARRHLKLNPVSEKPFLVLWQQAKPLSPRPEPLAELPDGVEVRSLPLAQARRLGLREPQGLSLSLSRGLLLLWVDGDDLWLIQQKS